MQTITVSPSSPCAECSQYGFRPGSEGCRDCSAYDKRAIKAEPVMQDVQNVVVAESEIVRDSRGNKRIYNDQKMLKMALLRGFESELAMLVHLYSRGGISDTAKELGLSYFMTRERMVRWGIVFRERGKHCIRQI